MAQDSDKRARMAHATAARGHRMGGAADLPLDYETAIFNGLSGWWWASIAAEAGAITAASYPLPEKDEAAAKGFARSFANFAPATVALARDQADSFVTQAIAAFHASLPLLRKARAASPIPEPLWREMDEAMWSAEVLGRRAAKSARTFVLLAREEGGVQ